MNFAEQERARKDYVDSLLREDRPGGKNLKRTIEEGILKRHQGRIGERVLREHGVEVVIRKTADSIYGEIDLMATQPDKRYAARRMSERFKEPGQAITILKERVGKVVADMYDPELSRSHKR